MKNIFQTNQLPTSLRNLPEKANILEILDSALLAVDPYQMVLRSISRSKSHFYIGNWRYTLDQFENVYLLAVGKAAVPMTSAVVDKLGDIIKMGIVLTKEGYADDNYLLNKHKLISLFEAGHPLPDERGVQASRQIEHLLHSTTDKDLVLCLLSGGGSALMSYPCEGVTLIDLVELTDQLLRCGATITEINSLRKHLEKLKGGRLATLAAPSTVISLILSDVVGDHLNVIASGPTVPDTSSFQNALDVLECYGLTSKISPSILKHLKHGIQGKISDTPKLNDAIFNHVHNIVIGSNQLACQAAKDTARKRGYHSMILTTCLEGEARQAGKFLASIGREICTHHQPVKIPACVIAGGETTVSVIGGGVGGRNLEVALGAVTDLAGFDNIALITLSSDGGDGPTDAAGAIITGATLIKAQEQGLDPNDFLKTNDSYNFFRQLGDLIITGPTGTNVNDLNFVFVFYCCGKY